MKILVTGGAGFIGSHIVEHYQGKADIVVLDNLRTGNMRNLDGLDHQFIEGTITNVQAVEQAMEGVDYVFHLAAMVSVPESMGNPLECVELNVNGTLNVLEAAAQAGVKKLCFSTSAAVYGENPESPKLETFTPEPKSPYAVTKLDGEYYCSIYHNEGRLKTACLRYFNVFGPRQDPKGPYAAAVPIFIEKAVAGEPITVHGDGGQTRDFIYVKDIVKANVWMAENENVSGVYNIAYGMSQTIGELAEKIVRLVGSSSEIVNGPERAGDIRHSLASVNKMNSAGLSLPERFDEGLTETIKYFKELGS